MGDRPILGISMGDPFGTGPEITVKALASAAVYDRCRPLVVGDVSSMDYALQVARKVNGIELAINPVKSVGEAKFVHGAIDVLDMGLVPAGKIPNTLDQAEPRPFEVGACEMGGEASFCYVEKVIQLALAEGINVIGKKPVPPDTVFSKALGGWYDIVVVMYHDQGHIPLKVKGFVYNKAEGRWDAVAGINVTLGLPIIRASVDHGTGFGHAGDGHANELSLVNAMDYAITLANHKKKTRDTSCHFVFHQLR